MESVLLRELPKRKPGGHQEVWLGISQPGWNLTFWPGEVIRNVCQNLLTVDLLIRPLPLSFLKDNIFPSFLPSYPPFIHSFFLFFFLSFFTAATAAHGHSQARGQIGAAAAGLHHSHSSADPSHIGNLYHAHSNARLLTHWLRSGIKNPWTLVGFVITEAQRDL